MSRTTKPPTKLDYEQSIRGSYNDVNSTLSVDGFIVGKVGHKVTLAISSTDLGGGEIDNTEVYSFYDNAALLYEIKIIYTDSTRALMVSAERIS